MAENGLVSVIITTYKREPSVLKKSIDCVLAQTCKELELIVVDDNGDNTPYRESTKALLDSYPQIKAVYHTKNQGAQKSRNDGILASKGEYIAFLDDDDFWMPEKCEKQRGLFDETIGLVYCKGWLLRYNEGEYIRTPYNMSGCFLTEVSFDDMLYGDCIGTTTQAMLSREAVALCGLFDIDQPTRQDYEMWVRVSKRMRCVGVDEFLFEHYIHKGEQISKDMSKGALGYLRVYYKNKKDYQKRPLSKCHILMAVANYYKLDKKFGKYFSLMFRAGLLLPKVLLFDYQNLKKRRALHKTRIATQKANL